MDRINLRGIVAHGRHGNDPGERDLPQPFHIDVSIDLDLTRASESDALEDTIDYSRVYERVVEIVEERSYSLLERLCAEVVDAVMADGRVMRAQATIAKPALLDGATPSVTLTRERQPWP